MVVKLANEEIIRTGSRCYDLRGNLSIPEELWTVRPQTIAGKFAGAGDITDGAIAPDRLRKDVILQ